MQLASDFAPRTTNLGSGWRERVIALLGGAVTALIGARRRSPLGLVAGLRGAAAALRGPRAPALPRRVATDGVEQRRTVLIYQPRHELYRQLRHLEHLAKFLDHLTGARAAGSDTAELVATIGTATIEWKAQIVEDVPGETIAWESLPGSELIAGGTYTLTDGPRGGTVVDLEIWYRPAMGVPTREPVLRFFERVTGRKMSTNLLALRQLVDRGDLQEPSVPANENVRDDAPTIVGPWPHSGEPAHH